MKANTVARKLIAIMLMVVMVTSVTAPSSFAVGEIGNPSGQEVELQKQEENSEKPDDAGVKEKVEAAIKELEDAISKAPIETITKEQAEEIKKKQDRDSLRNSIVAPMLEAYSGQLLKNNKSNGKV